jgi:hypothetical protein
MAGFEGTGTALTFTWTEYRKLLDLLVPGQNLNWVSTGHEGPLCQPVSFIFHLVVR